MSLLSEWHVAPTYIYQILSRRSRIRARIGHHRTLFVYTRECMLCEPTPVIQCLDRSMRRHSTIADIAYCLYHTRRCVYTRTYTTCTFLFLNPVTYQQRLSLFVQGDTWLQHSLSNHGHLLKLC